MTAASQAINKLIKNKRNGFVTFTCAKTFIHNQRPNDLTIDTIYEVQSGKVVLHKRNYRTQEWSSTKLN